MCNIHSLNILKIHITFLSILFIFFYISFKYLKCYLEYFLLFVSHNFFLQFSYEVVKNGKSGIIAQTRLLQYILESYYY